MIQYEVIDGEGIGDSYFFLATFSNGELYTGKPLRTLDIFDFLISIKCPLFIFGITYDVNHWLCDIPKHILFRIFRANPVTFIFGGFTWRIHYVPRKKIIITKYKTSNEIKNYYRGEKIGSCCVYDSWGLWQTSFASVLHRFTNDDISLIEDMKKTRHQFNLKNIEKIKVYCRLELFYFNQIIYETLRFLKEKKWKPTQLTSAASISSVILKEKNIKSKQYTAEEQDILLRSYFGGRVEMLQIGFQEKPILQKDINSAYAHELMFCFGKQKLLKIKWNFPEGYYFYPFPFRSKEGNIFYPRTGIGWMWEKEYNVANLCYWNPNIKLEILEEKTIELQENDFLFLRDIYDERKKENHLNERLLKCILSSMHGKFAQTLGRSKWNDLAIASLVCSRVRARLLYEAAGLEEKVICFATDSIYFNLTQPHHNEDEKDFGKWRSKVEGEKFLMAAPGVYSHIGKDYEKVGSRGYEKGSLESKKILATWKKHGENGRLECRIPVQVRRFMGFLSSEMMGYGRNCWVNQVIDFSINGISEKSSLLFSGETWEPWKRLIHLRPEENVYFGESQPYVQKKSSFEKEVFLESRLEEELEERFL